MSTTTRCPSGAHDVAESCPLHGCPACRRDYEPYVHDPDDVPTMSAGLERLHGEHVDPVTGECALCAELIDRDYVRRYPGVLCERRGCSGCPVCGRVPEPRPYEPTLREQAALERDTEAIRRARRRHHAHLLERGLRQLQRVPCRYEPGAECVSCGPDVEQLLTLADLYRWEDR